MMKKMRIRLTKSELMVLRTLRSRKKNLFEKQYMFADANPLGLLQSVALLNELNKAIGDLMSLGAFNQLMHENKDKIYRVSLTRESKAKK